MSMPMIDVRDLRIDFDNVCAVRDLNLQIAAGEIFGLIGPNGAGKTSTMRALAGLLEPTYGEIELDGLDIRDKPEEAQHVVGFMPDFPPMYDDLLVWEFLDLFAASYFVPKPERPRVIQAYLELVGLVEKRAALVAELSRGMRQRLMLAKTLLTQPKILLFDEPASGLDPSGRAYLKQAIRDMAAEGRAILISSHILSELSEICTAVGIMEQGRMVISGPLDDIAAQVRGATVIVTHLISGEDQFRQLIDADPQAGELTQHQSRFEFSFAGDADAASDLLTKAIGAGVRVASFAPREESLEQVFLQVGAQELS